jgi:branched-chain amino acid transport system substrate-binding protein
MRLVLTLAAAALALAGCVSRQAAEPVYLGQVVTLSGPDDALTALGTHSRQGVQLALDTLSEDQRRVAGRRVAVLHADGKGDENQVRGEAVRLIKVNRVAALLGGPRAALAERVAREAQPDGVPLLLPVEMPPTPRGDNVFSLAVSPAVRGQALAGRLAETLPEGARVVVLTDATDAVSGAVSHPFVQELRKTAPKVRVEEWTVRDAPEPAALLKDRPAAVLLACPPREFAKQRQRLLEAGYDGPTLYGGEDAGPHELREPGAGQTKKMPKSDEGGPAGQGGGGPVVLATVYSPDGLTDQGREFARKYEEKFGAPPDLSAAQGYDGARLLLDALRRAGGTAAPRVREELAATKGFETVTGPLSFRKDRSAKRRLFLVEVKDGRATLLATREPEGE